MTISNANSFTGPVTINGGKIAVGTVANGGVNSPLGAGTSVVLGGGALSYTGNTASTNRGVTVNSPGGTVEVTTSGQVLTLAGTVSGAGMLTKTGAGQLALGGTNTLTGAVIITGGTLSVATIGNGGVAGNLGQQTNAASNLVFNGGELKYIGATASTDLRFHPQRRYDQRDQCQLFRNAVDDVGSRSRHDRWPDEDRPRHIESYRR